MERILFTFVEMVGQVATAHLADGTILEGVFASYSPVEKAIMLLKCRRLVSEVHSLSENSDAKDVSVIPTVNLIQLKFSRICQEQSSIMRHLREKQITRSESCDKSVTSFANWADEDDEDEDDVLEKEKSHRAGSWDQFKANEHLVRGKSTYDELLYTTSIPKNLTRDQREYAERAARKIERGKVVNLQHAVDRGIEIGADYDEERLFSRRGTS